jgi:hypothetical protein
VTRSAVDALGELALCAPTRPHERELDLKPLGGPVKRPPFAEEDILAAVAAGRVKHAATTGSPA